MESKEYYKAIAEAREFTIDTILKPSMEILSARGVVLSMIGELTSYGIKNGQNEKYFESMKRLLLLDEFLDSCNKVNDHNYQLRWLLNNSIHQRNKQQVEIETLKKQLESINKAFNAGE